MIKQDLRFELSDTKVNLDFPKEHRIIIDFHHHYRKSEKEFLDKLLEDMDSARVNIVCLLTSEPRYGEREEKDWKRILKDHHDRVVGFGTVNPGKLPENKPEIVDQYYSEGFKGLNFLRPTKRYDHDDFLDYYEKAEEYNMPAIFHTGVIGRRSFKEREDVSSEFMRPIYLDRIARLFPKLKIDMAHIGDPWFGEAFNVSQKSINIWIDMSGKGMWLKAVALREHLGIRLSPEKLIFGLDEPSSQYIRLIDFWETVLMEMGINQKHRDMIFGETAAKILGIE